ncbi:MAG: Methionine import ATP-binding protein MetN [Chlamydiae bacterium]|nr:Methionine import ATP-binding protein MetN [Chlamydiota bacterium]
MSALIEFRGVSKRFYRAKHPEVHALRHVNISIEKGDIFGIIGLSGAGKSTLLRCLATIEKPSIGKIFIRGQEVTNLNGSALRSVRLQMGLIFQHFNLFSSRTVKGNIAYPMEIAGIGREERRKRVSELLALVGLKEQGDAYPSQLSGGQKQRVGIARALANAPEILLCDEATSSLDPTTTQEILALIKDLQQKLELTVVLITHEMEVIKQICNKVAVIDDGEIVEMGKISQVFVEPKHPATKKFVEKAIHEIPTHLLSGKGKVLHLHFKGKKADQPIITQMAKKFQVDANILLGWIDSLQTVTVGNLIIELTGDAIEEAIVFLREQGVLVEEKEI